MRVLRRGEKKPDPDEEHAKEMTRIEEGKPREDGIDINWMLRRALDMLYDSEFATDLRDDPQTKQMYAAFSHLNRLGYITRKERDILELEYTRMILVHKITMNEDEYERKNWIKNTALGIHKTFLLSDSVDGWKGRLMVERRTIIRTEVAKEQKKRLGIF